MRNTVDVYDVLINNALSRAGLRAVKGGFTMTIQTLGRLRVFSSVSMGLMSIVAISSGDHPRSGCC